MIYIKRYDLCDIKIWNEFNYHSKTQMFMFDRNYMDYHKDRFSDHSLMFYRNEKLIAVLPACVEGDNIISHGGLTYGGLILPDTIKQHTVNECFGALIRYLRDKGIKRLYYKPVPHIYHQQPGEEDLYSLFCNKGHPIEIAASTVINLLEPLKMTKGRKAQINRAKREGIEIKKLKEYSDFVNFIELENEVLQSRHNVKSVHTGDELYMLFKRFPKNIHLYGAIFKEKLIAGTVIFEYSNIIHTQYMASNELSREIGGLDLVICTVIDEYKSLKKWLDFGISTENGGKLLNEGLIAQKESFGGRTNIYQMWELEI